MRVQVTDAVFADVDATVDLVVLMRTCDLPRGAPVHRLLVPPTAAVSAWLDRQSLEIREAWNQTVLAGAGADATDPLTQRIVVHDQADDWDATPARLSLATAVSVLGAPLTIMCEDAASDGRFLASVVAENQRPWFGRLREQGLITFEGVGGVTQFRRVMDLGRGGALRRFAFMDSDALIPGRPHRNAVQAVEHCEAARVRHHRLSRRFAESYLDDQELHVWIASHKDRQTRTKLESLAAALRASPPSLRHHFNMKHGDDGDQGRLSSEPDDVKTRWSAERASLELRTREALRSGFGDDVGRAFREDLVATRDPELATLVTTIRECL